MIVGDDTTKKDDKKGDTAKKVPDGWKEFTPPNKSFKAYFPGTPKKTAGISTFHCPGTGLSQGARQVSRKTKGSAVKNTGGM